MIAILKSVLVLLFAVSLVCGTAAMAHGVPGGDLHGGAHVMQDAAAHACDACEAPDMAADMACPAMGAHCAAAIASVGGATMVERAELRMERIAPVNLLRSGAGPESDTPPPRS